MIILKCTVLKSHDLLTTHLLKLVNENLLFRTCVRRRQHMRVRRPLDSFHMNYFVYKIRLFIYDVIIQYVYGSIYPYIMY